MLFGFRVRTTWTKSSLKLGQFTSRKPFEEGEGENYWNYTGI